MVLMVLLISSQKCDMGFNFLRKRFFSLGETALFMIRAPYLDRAFGFLNKFAPLCIQRTDGTKTKLVLSSASLGFTSMCCPIQQLLESRETDRLDAATSPVRFVEHPQLFRCSCCRLPTASEG